ncbi:constitutive coactivator of PPAR-gamma-like protein 1 [Cimex lectularius]|uniref:Constitutive coactivator of PPAR-gamma-like protein 1 homolog n=1 Tax=Cimex lectularius TaxID=79782 RepID=A0A8I6SAA3_CIMLE|nr:constitutive coactivator of PPAR-gamma-like protein 1 [Cimex lectularius]
MGIQDLQVFLEGSHIEGSCVGVDLVRIARSQAAKWLVKNPQKKGQNIKFSIVVDAECCLDRLYGGYFSDWVCGGQWNRVTTFLGQLVSSLNLAKIDLAVFFNGCTEPQRTEEWIQKQFRNRQRINHVLRHLSMKGTPPPKIWWIPPSCLRPTLRMVLRNLNVPVVVTMEDHKQEVIAYCRENMCHAILADDAEYVAFNPPRYFSARHLKLTYKGTLESKEYIIAEVMKGLELTQEQLCVLAALLGNFLLPESELSDLYKKLNVEPKPGKDGTVADAPSEKVRAIAPEKVRAVAGFVRSLSSTDINDLATEIFGVVGGERAEKFKQAVQYYLDGTKNGTFKFQISANGKKTEKKGLAKLNEKTENSEPGMDTSRLASESTGNELDGLITLTEAVACLSVGPEIVVNVSKTTEPHEPTAQINGEKAVNGNHNLLTMSSSGSSSGATSPYRTAENGAKPKKTVRLVVEEEKIELHPVAAEIMRTVTERHTKGLMSPFIYQILTEGEVKLPVVMEDENHKDIPSVQLFYRPLRMMVYAILFNLHHLQYIHKNNKAQGTDSKPPEVKVKEWIWSRSNPYEKPEIVKAEPLGWGVPTVQRLWFGTTVDDKRRRLRAYLTCMRSDTQLMLDPTYVPQQLLILATVLRYIMSNPEMRMLKKQELDAIISMAMDPHLNNSEFNQELQVNCVSTRGIQIGALIMTGIEYALLVNDTCGAPIPWVMTCPWLYFDGKLLHAMLARSETANNLPELCNYRTIQVGKVERMREAILDGLYIQWAQPMYIPALAADSSRVHSVMPAGLASKGSTFTRGAGALSSVRGRGMTTGGRLEIAGVVVGNWGPNCRFHHQNLMVPQTQVTSIGNVGYNGGSAIRGGKNPTYTTRGGSALAQCGKGRVPGKVIVNGKKKNAIVSKKDGRKTRGRGMMTIVSPINGKVVNASVFIDQDYTEFEEKKRILINNEPKKQTTNANESVIRTNGDNAQSNQFASAPVASGGSCGAKGSGKDVLTPAQLNDN